MIRDSGKQIIMIVLSIDLRLFNSTQLTIIYQSIDQKQRVSMRAKLKSRMKRALFYVQVLAMMSEKYITTTITASKQRKITLIVEENKRFVDDDDDDCKVANYLNNNTGFGGLHVCGKQRGDVFQESSPIYVYILKPETKMHS